jgi:integrase
MPRPNPPQLSRDNDRHGNVRWYVRVPGQPKVRIRETYGTPAFWNAYRDALAGKVKQVAKPGRQPTAPGSFRALCDLYFKCAEFKGLETSTRTVRRGILERFCLMTTPAGKRYGDLPYRPMLPKHVRAIRDSLAETPGAANSLLKTLRQIFSFAIDNDHADGNPAKEVPYLPPVKADGIPAWNEDEVALYEARHPIGTPARLALLLFVEFGQRISDIHRVGPKDIRGDHLVFTQHKNRRRKPITLSLPVSEELRAAVAQTRHCEEAFMVNDWGIPFASTASFGNKFRDWCRAAGVSKSAHGLRKYFSARLAEHGASDREIMSMTGHRTSKEVDRYTRSASQKRLAKHAMDKMKPIEVVPPISKAPESGTKKSVKPLKINENFELMVPRAAPH